MDDTTKLLTLAEACSDALLGGDHGWEQMDFNEFVTEVRKAIVYGVKCNSIKTEPNLPESYGQHGFDNTMNFGPKDQ